MSIQRPQTVWEERANAISHGLGCAAAVAGAPLLIVSAMQTGGAAGVVGAAVFAATTILLYLTSAIYHALPMGRTKRVFKLLDHSAIYLLIAGTYTPFTLGVLRGTLGWTLFGIVWGLALGGIIVKSIGALKCDRISTFLYLAMGWLVLIAIKPLIAGMPMTGFLWLAAGGIAYSAGVFFYATDQRYRFGHFIWHLFVIAGTGCHFVAVWRYAG
ncbi:MAG: hemolysin III family protein [Verrucomicrobiae bacterium]|nr:hemolysin III family protein [Verrucomicrobiae bacterium]